MSSTTKQYSSALAALVVVIAAAVVSTAPAVAGNESQSATRLVWSRFKDQQFSAAGIVIADPDGRNLRTLTSPAAGAVDVDPELSPDGSTVLFMREYNDRVEIRVVGTDGRGERLLDFGCVYPCADDIGPNWAPDGRRITFTRVIGPFDPETGDAASAQLYIADLKGRSVRRLSDGPAEDNRARWAPDGSYFTVIRVARIDGEIRSAVFRLAADGSDARQLTPWDLDADMHDLSQATAGPTKGLVVFETFGHGTPDGQTQNIATVPANCRTLAACTAAIRYVTKAALPVVAMNPTWSPDGTRIAMAEFSRPTGEDQTINSDIWALRPDGTGRQRVSHQPQFEFRPDWGVDRRCAS